MDGHFHPRTEEDAIEMEVTRGARRELSVLVPK